MTHRIVILGGGVGGTLLANLLARKLNARAKPRSPSSTRPGGTSTSRAGSTSPSAKSSRGIWSEPSAATERARPAASPRRRRGSSRRAAPRAGRRRGLRYDTLVVATGARLAPETVPGLCRGRPPLLLAGGGAGAQEGAASIRGRQARDRRRRHPLQMPAGAAGVRLQGRGVPDEARRARQDGDRLSLADQPRLHHRERLGVRHADAGGARDRATRPSSTPRASTRRPGRITSHGRDEIAYDLLVHGPAAPRRRGGPDSGLRRRAGLAADRPGDAAGQGPARTSTVSATRPTSPSPRAARRRTSRRRCWPSG